MIALFLSGNIVLFRMGAYAPILNKTMLPDKNKAIISYIIEQFSEDTKFVVALGYKGEDVRSYLTLAHPHTNFTFVTVNNFSGPLSGPAYSLSCCRQCDIWAFQALC
jgi:NDP-sugar pyrophosphorylase family protein